MSMKFTFHCTSCAAIDGIDVAYEGVALDIRDDGIYEFKCLRGHESFMELQQERFQILFEIGVRAIGDTYYREAVSSFTAALERFYEFCIRVYIVKVVRQSDTELTFENFQKAWDQVGKMSERQYGAYILLHTALTSTLPSLQSNKEREFRNNVIHAGIYSTKADAITYGDSVLRLLREGIEILRSKFAEELEVATQWSRMAVRAKAPQGVNIGLLYYPTLVSLLDEGGDARSKITLAELIG